MVQNDQRIHIFPNHELNRSWNGDRDQYFSKNIDYLACGKGCLRIRIFIENSLLLIKVPLYSARENVLSWCNSSEIIGYFRAFGFKNAILNSNLEMGPFYNSIF